MITEQQIQAICINIDEWTKKRVNFIRLARINPGHRDEFLARAQPLAEAIERAEREIAEWRCTCGALACVESKGRRYCKQCGGEAQFDALSY